MSFSSVLSEISHYCGTNSIICLRGGVCYTFKTCTDGKWCFFKFILEVPLFLKIKLAIFMTYSHNEIKTESSFQI